MSKKILLAAALALLVPVAGEAGLRAVGEPFELADCEECTNLSSPSLAGSTTGRFYVTWGAELPEISFSAFGRAFDVADGPTPGRRLGVDPARLTGHRDVAADGAGGFVVLWQHPAEIWLDRLDGAGAPTAPSFRVNAPPTGADDDLARLGVDDDGHAVVAFFTQPGGGVFGVYAQGVFPDNRVAGPASLLSGAFPLSVVGGLQVVALGDTGSFYVLWQTRASDDEPQGAAGPRGLSLRRVDRQGAPLGPEIVLREPSGSERTLSPHLAADPRGEFLVVSWATREPPARAGRDVVAQLVGPDGETLAEPFVLSKKSGGAQLSPGVAFTPRAQMVAVWETLKGGESRIWARRLRRSGGFRGREKPVIPALDDPDANTEFGSLRPRVASVGGGLAVVVWRGADGPLGQLVSGAR